MIKPEDIQDKVTTITERDAAERREVEKQFDEAITFAADNGRWPAVVRATRDGITRENTEAVAELYREAGWHVSTSGDANVRASISRAIVSPKAKR